MNSRQLLELLVDATGQGQSGVARAAKVNQPTISRFISGATKALQHKNAVALARHLNVPVVALLDDSEAATYARKHGLQAVAAIKTGEPVATYDVRPGWPFSAELWHQVSQLDPNQLAKLETLMRVHLDMPAGLPFAPPAPRVANG